MADPARVIRIVDWTKHFENNRTKELKHLDWVPIPNRMDGDGYTQLVDHPNGGAHLGAWIAIVQIASRSEPRGVLLRNGGSVPHNSQSLARISRLPATLFDEVIDRLIEIQWIECVDLESVPLKGSIAAGAALVKPDENGHKSVAVSVTPDPLSATIPQGDATIPHSVATIPQDDASLRAHAEARSQKGKKGREGKGTEGNGKKGRERKNTNGHFVDLNFSPEKCVAFLADIGWSTRSISDDQVEQILALDPAALPDVDAADTLPGIFLRLDQFQNHFWPNYWRKVARKAAREAWMRATEDASVIADILRAEEKQAPAMRKREDDKRPHATTWLNQQRWNDEVEAE